MKSYFLLFPFLLQTLSFEGFADDAPAAITNNEGVTFPDQIQVGNCFSAGEKVQIAVAVREGDSVDWKATDYHDVQVGAGSATVSGGKATIAPSPATVGFYVLHVTAKSGADAKGEGTTTYAVIPPLDNSKMPRARFGVASHFGKFMTPDLGPVLAKAGVIQVRDSMDWSWVETKPDEYDFTVHDWTSRIAELEKEHIGTLFNIVFGNELHYDDHGVQPYAAAPHTQDQYDAYTKFCLAHLKQFGPSVQQVEIWNEYNGSFAAGKAAEDRPKYYTEMLKDAYTAIKAERRDVMVLGGALNGIPLPYAEKLFQNGALDYMDGIVVHNYGGTASSIEGDVRNLVDLMKKYNHGKAKGIWVTEFGDWSDKTLVRNEEAGRLTQIYAMFLNQPEVARAFWYLARDYPDEGFPTMGLVHKPDDAMGKYTPTAVYSAYATMANQLYDAQPMGKEAVDPRTNAYHFSRDGKSIWVCWSDYGETSLEFKTASPLRKINFVGGEEKLSPAGGTVTVKLDKEPFYVIADKSSDVASVRESGRTDVVVADSQVEFSGEEGKAGWSYLYGMAGPDDTSTGLPSDLKPMTWQVSPGLWNYQWVGPGNWFSLGAAGASPTAADGKQMWAVRRWTSTVDGPIHITGVVDRPDENGDGIGCRIFLDGKEISAKLLPPKGHEDLDMTATVQKGAQLDFAITTGSGTDPGYDATGFHAVILQPLPK